MCIIDKQRNFGIKIHMFIMLLPIGFFLVILKFLLHWDIAEVYIRCQRYCNVNFKILKLKLKAMKGYQIVFYLLSMLEKNNCFFGHTHC